MPTPIEYALGQYQSHNVSLAIKAHRTETGDDPQLDVIQPPGGVTTIRLLNLGRGGAQVVSGQRRQNHMDWYVLEREKLAFIAALPAANVPPDRSLLRPTLNPVGTERVGGKHLQDPMPLFRLPAETIRIHAGATQQFLITGTTCDLHLDYEIGPARLYGVETPELHFGVTADDWQEAESIDDSDWCEVDLSDAAFATLVSELRRL